MAASFLIRAVTPKLTLFSNCNNILKQDRTFLPGVYDRAIVAAVSYTGYRNYSNSFVTGTTAQQLWDSATGVSNAGRKRGRGKNIRRRRDLNIGQRIGEGKAGMRFPGLTGPPLVGNQRITMHKVSKPEDEKEPVTFKRKREKIPALQRGYSGRKFPGTSIGPPDPIYDYKFENFDTRILEYKFLSKMTGTLGRVQRASVCVVTGNGNGLAGWAVGKAPMGKSAMKKAKNMAAQRLQYIELYNGHTVFHNFAVKEGCTTVFVQKMPKGYGLRAHRVVKTLCQIIGIEDLRVKVEGRTKNIQNIVKAFFQGLMEMETHQQLADRLQLHVVEYKEELDNVPIPVASPTQGYTRKDGIKEEAFDFDNMYYKDGKIPLAKDKDPLAFYKTSEKLWKVFLRKDKFRNQMHSKFLRIVHDLEPSDEEKKLLYRPLK